MHGVPRRIHLVRPQARTGYTHICACLVQHIHQRFLIDRIGGILAVRVGGYRDRLGLVGVGGTSAVLDVDAGVRGEIDGIAVDRPLFADAVHLVLRAGHAAHIVAVGHHAADAARGNAVSCFDHAEVGAVKNRAGAGNTADKPGEICGSICFQRHAAGIHSAVVPAILHTAV